MSFQRDNIEGLLNNNNMTDNEILITCNSLIPQLEQICENENVKENLLLDVQEIIKYLIWMKELMEQEVDSLDYGYSNWSEAFGEQIEKLCNIGNIVIVKNLE